MLQVKQKQCLNTKKRVLCQCLPFTPLDLSKISGYVENQPSDTIISKVFLKAKEKSEFIALQSSPAEKKKKNESSELKFITNANFDGVSAGLKPKLIT